MLLFSEVVLFGLYILVLVKKSIRSDNSIAVAIVVVIIVKCYMYSVPTLLIILLLQA